MEIGDLVKIKRFPNSGAMFLVLERDHRPWDADRHNDSSKFASWVIQDTASSKVYTQIARTLEVISESR